MQVALPELKTITLAAVIALLLALTPAAAAPVYADTPGAGPDAATAFEIPAEGGAVSVGAMQSGQTVTLLLPSDKVAEIIAATEDDIATFDLAGAAGATEAVLPRAAVIQITDLNIYVEIKLPQGTVMICEGAAASAASQATGDSLTVSLGAIDHSLLTPAQREAVSPGDQVYRVSVTSGDQVIHSFDGGTVTVSVPYSGPLPVTTWHLSETGETTKIATAYHNATRIASFMTLHLSDFVVKKDEDPYNLGVAALGKDETQGAPPASGAITLWIDSFCVEQGATALPEPPVAPQIMNGRTMLPFRYLAQTLLGGEVDWDEATRTVTASLGGHDFEMRIDDPVILVDGETLDLGQAPVIVDGHTLLPLRAFEAAVAEIRWDEAARTVTVTP